MSPGYLELVLLGLAAYRTWRLLAEDTILDPVRERMGYGLKFLRCPWCSGFWIALAWWGAWQLWPHGTLVTAGAAAISAIVGFLGWAISG